MAFSIGTVEEVTTTVKCYVSTLRAVFFGKVASRALVALVLVGVSYHYTLCYERGHCLTDLALVG